MPKGSEIDAFGDSMMVGAIHAMRYYLPKVRVDAKSNRRWSQAPRWCARGDSLRRAVVLAFGTNAGTDEKAIRRTLAEIGPNRMVVIVTEHGRFARVEADNEQLRAIVAGMPNVRLAEWDAALAGTSGQLQPDGIHPSLKGSHLYAKTVRQAFADLSQAHTGTTGDAQGPADALTPGAGAAIMRVMSGSGPAPLVSSEEELAVLRAALAAAASDGAAGAGARRRRRRGIGKTHLVGALRKTVGARPRRALVLGAQVCLDLAPVPCPTCLVQPTYLRGIRARADVNPEVADCTDTGTSPVRPSLDPGLGERRRKRPTTWPATWAADILDGSGACRVLDAMATLLAERRPGPPVRWSVTGSRTSRSGRRVWRRCLPSSPSC